MDSALDAVYSGLLTRTRLHKQARPATAGLRLGRLRFRDTEASATSAPGPVAIASVPRRGRDQSKAAPVHVLRGAGELKPFRRAAGARSERGRAWGEPVICRRWPHWLGSLASITAGVLLLLLAVALEAQQGGAPVAVGSGAIASAQHAAVSPTGEAGKGDGSVLPERLPGRALGRGHRGEGSLTPELERWVVRASRCTSEQLPMLETGLNTGTDEEAAAQQAPCRDWRPGH